MGISDRLIGRVDDDPTEGTIDEADIHDVLRNERRRLTLEQLRDSDGTESVGDLAEHIAEVESGESPPPKNVRQSVYISLHQTHLPKLDTLHIVAYDSTAKVVSLGTCATELDPYFDDGDEGTTPFAVLSFTTCLAGLALLFAGWMGMPVIAGVDPRFVAIVTLLAVALVSGAELGLRTQNRT
ncbi:hypothetical protein E6P09_12605 [Haloferax mediterranei ATCC 33500]|uniref:DUF7344 domain-containing protein n=1 Tax=Haloferax mediterranei (strain ATCC 33500 / DSM 1411 / JCM 8866 / NBRC 14739 / NCIMB 2177 / R-4) TaxID=523841 RepID=I3R8E5_HALMT|nr:hypothetical protein [Haloferax mediterranei]AFK20505.1 hypothetical protein HFX_2834 [Haloferax mediterranei ATCC 33500]AHZ23864.1 hypothetical protein BM92_14970 [Haloferax mediterranei ATCC 33500]ELZ98288.1 hypothetical protein C439_15925 [Haloferax mediterranei ATCC 33500]MDX5986739.1 hypothetical protein [Haloferax mediterranei ATCC 33500]QCQ76063.1 hypothetical protein E6P09_12605 [Haloferax mediterranei ATCC 33500]